MNDTINNSFDVIMGVADKLNPIVSKIAVAVLILLIGLIIGKLIGNLIRRALIEISLDKFMRSAGIRFSLANFISGFVSYTIYFITIVMFLNSLGLTTAILNIISGAIVFVVAVSFLLGVKDFFPNFIAGIRIKNNKLFKEGDEIQIKEVRGKILSLGLLETRLLTIHNEEVIIPNAIFNRRQIVIRNKSHKSSKDKKRKR